VGSIEVLQHTPFSIISELPGDEISPPQTAEVWVIEETSTVDKVGTSSFLQDKNKIRNKFNKDINRIVFFDFMVVIFSGYLVKLDSCKML
jgi:hypothetical protein